MSLQTLERDIVAEIRIVTKNSKFRVKDLMEWKSAEITPQDGEKVVFLPGMRLWAAFKKELDKSSGKG